ncbi:TPA: argininosuccinate synthase [bacterium]|nr:argininosuccinate synthase [bacterium]
MERIALAYSGGLDTSVIIRWLKENYQAEVIAMIADLGQEEDWSQLESRAYKTGASKVYVEDLREEFVCDFIYPALKANALYESKYLLGTALARPLIAKRLVEIAWENDASALAHGATGKGNDQVRFELTFKVLAPELKIVAPWREWNLRSRQDEIAYAKEHGIEIGLSEEKPYSIDQNLWHTSYEGGILEDPTASPDENMFLMSVSPEKAPDEPSCVEISLEEGIPKKVNDEELSPVELIRHLNLIAGRNGIGRVDLVENRLVGMKSRGVYETPGGTLLYLAHKELESLTLDRETLHYKELISPKYAELIYNGLWYSPLRLAFDAFVDVTQKKVTGSVRLKLYKGNCIIVGRNSPYSLYRQDLATFEEDRVYDQKDAQGFINLFGLPLSVLGRRERLEAKDL